MNFVHIAGHLGADPEVRFTSSGQKVTVLRVAANARKSGKDETIWWRVTIWGEQFDKMIPYFKKGSPIVVFGELNKPEIFMDREGKPQISMGITALSLQFSPFGKPERQGQGQQPAQSHEGGESSHGGHGEMVGSAVPFANYGHKSHGEGRPDSSDDEVPF